MTPRNAQEEAMSHVALLGTRSLLRSGLVSLLGSLGFERVDEAATLDALIAQTHGDTRPDIVLINVSNGVDAARLVFDIRSWAPEAKVVFLFSDLDVRTLVGCFSAGASGYLLESLSGEALQKSLTLISAGEKVFPSELAGVISDLAGKREMASNPTDLQNIEFTPREIWILRLLADGRSNKMIASSLNISESTAKLHLRNILRKLRANNRTQAALWALERGLVLANVDTPGGVAGESSSVTRLDRRRGIDGGSR
ncbi:MAG TPA: response regulator transcription factor [Bradyrhizobium sp.]|jgi:two-component system nitrate/nitrite response regulator NarL|nr:response regulator transcription factor [Bradyrhizobium sp.]